MQVDSTPSGLTFRTLIAAALLSGVLAGVAAIIAVFLRTFILQKVDDLVFCYYMLGVLTRIPYLWGPAIARRKILFGALSLPLTAVIVFFDIFFQGGLVLTTMSKGGSHIWWGWNFIAQVLRLLMIYLILAKMYGTSWKNRELYLAVFFSTGISIGLSSLVMGVQKTSAEVAVLTIMLRLILPILQLLPQAFVAERELNRRAAAEKSATLAVPV